MVAKLLVSKDDVRKVAEEKMLAQGKVTNLDIKNELRIRGFWAKQSDVSQAMAELQDELGWEFFYNGTYREYYKPDPADPVLDSSSPKWWATSDHHVGSIPTSAKVTKVTLVGSFGDSIDPPKLKKEPWNAKMLKTPVDGCWRAYVGTGKQLSNVVRYYPPEVTRDAARYALAKLLSIKKVETRAERWFA